MQPDAKLEAPGADAPVRPEAGNAADGGAETKSGNGEVASERIPTVLVADDEIITRTKICNLLKHQGFNCIEAEDGLEAVELSRSQKPDIILLDVVMPGLGGFDVLEEVKRDERLGEVPVFMLTARDSSEERVRGFDLGASDYIIKPFSTEELVCRMKLALRQSGERRETFSRLRRLQALNASAGLLDEEEGTEGGHRLIPVVDPTTDLPSLSSYLPELSELLKISTTLSVLYVNLSKVDIIENKHGAELCDDILKQVTTFMEDFLATTDTGAERVVLARYGGDDFVVFLSDLEQAGEHAAHMERLISELEDSLTRSVKRVYGDEVATLLEFFVGNADIKRETKVRAPRQIFRGLKRAQREAMDVGKRNADKKKSLLRKCLREEALVPVYQPIVATEHAPEARVLGYEVLTRGTLEGFRNPQMLYDVAEMSGLVWELSRIIRRLAIQPVRWMKEDELLFVNMHPADFTDPQFLRNEISDDEYSSIAHRIVFEVTEREAIHNFDLFKDFLTPLRQRGYRIAVDDLGSGYSGLTSLAVLEPEFIKFDMSLIRDIDKYPRKQNLLKTMISFARDTNSKVVAEGVETAAEAMTLMELGCHFLQGYYFARPAAPFPEVKVPIPMLDGATTG